MDPTAPGENPFLRVRLRGVWAWILIFGLVLAPLALAAYRAGWLVPRRDLLFVLGAWLYAAPLAWMLHRSRRLGIDVRRLIGRPARSSGWLDAVMIVPLQLLFAAFSFLLMIAALSKLFPAGVVKLLEDPETMSIAPPGAPRPLVALMLVLVAPVVEELLFRGLLLHTLASRWGFRRAAFATAAIFALLHANLIGIFVFGLVLTVLYMKTRSLLAPMLCHALNNLIPFLMSLQAPAASPPQGADALAGARSHVGFVAITATLSGLIMVGYLRQSWPARGTPLPYGLPDRPAGPEPGGGGVTALNPVSDGESTSSRDRPPAPPPA